MMPNYSTHQAIFEYEMTVLTVIMMAYIRFRRWEFYGSYRDLCTAWLTINRF